MTNALTIRNDMDIQTLGDVLAKSGFFQDTRQAAQAIVKVLAGQELGFGPVASMTGINIIKGRVTISANLMAAAVKRAGKYNYRVIEMSDEACELEFFEAGQSVGTSRFTTDDAQRAGLTGENWRKYPKNMLFARAMSNGAKWFAPDVFGGSMYTPEELGDESDTNATHFDPDTGEVIEGTFTNAQTPPEPPAHAETEGDKTPDAHLGQKNPPKESMADEMPQQLTMDAYDPAGDTRKLTSKTWPDLRQAIIDAGYADEVNHAWNTLNKALTVAGVIGDGGWKDILAANVLVKDAWAAVVAYRAQAAA